MNASEPAKTLFSRRGFLSLLGLGGAAVVLAPLLPASAPVVEPLVEPVVSASAASRARGLEKFAAQVFAESQGRYALEEYVYFEDTSLFTTATFDVGRGGFAIAPWPSSSEYERHAARYRARRKIQSDALTARIQSKVKAAFSLKNKRARA